MQSTKGKEKFQELPLTRKDVMFQKYQNFVDFMTLECFPKSGLEKWFESFDPPVSPDSLHSFLQEFLVPNWVGENLSNEEVRAVLDSVLSRTLVENPEYFDNVNGTTLSPQDLTDAQINKIYRYGQLFVHLATCQQ